MEVIDNTNKLPFDMCDFITEVKKENGNDYSPGSMYDLVACLSAYIDRKRPD